MPVAKPGEVWQTDLGMVAKVRPCLVLTLPPANDELAVATVVAHTTALRGNRWEVKLPKAFLQPGAFDVQRVVTVGIEKFERKLGELTQTELDTVLGALRARLGL